MNIGIVIPGFSSDEHDWAIPVQLNLAREQAKHTDYRVIALRYPHRRDRYTVFGARVFSLGFGAWARGLKRLELWRETLRLLETLHREQPFDVLHAMWADECGMIAGIFGRRHGIPVVVSVMGGELARLPEIDYGGGLTRYGRWITREALKRANRVHVVSGYVDQLLDAAGIPAEKRTKIPLGVDAARFRPSGTAYRANHLVCAASLIPVKNHMLLLKALSHLPGVTLDLIGDGTERRTLENLTNALGIGDRVRFLGAQPHPDMPPLLEQAALHILTSHHETFALSILEAAACGVPSISTAVGMLPDYPSIGRVFEGDDPAELAELIKQLLNEPEALNALRRSARATVERELTIEHTAARLRSLYAELINAQ